MSTFSKQERIFQIISDLATVSLISVAFLLIYLFINPYDRGFYCNDETIRFPYLEDTVPLWAAALMGALAGISFVFIAELYINRQCCADKSEFKANNLRWALNSINGTLLYCLGAACTMLITEIGKHSIGRLRPHFIAVCDPDWDKIECFSKIDDVLIPKGDPKLIKEARLSFPSGHSSFTVFSMVFVIIYIEARLGRPKRCNFIKSSIQLTAFIAAWFTCMSRVSDFKHHHTDVIAGAFIGLTVALFVTFVTGKHIWDFQRVKFEKKLVDEIENIEDVYELREI